MIDDYAKTYLRDGLRRVREVMLTKLTCRGGRGPR